MVEREEGGGSSEQASKKLAAHSDDLEDGEEDGRRCHCGWEL